jgi:hypothetical protein
MLTAVKMTAQQAVQSGRSKLTNHRQRRGGALQQASPV